jgi:uncharacterized membrane protein YfcA
MPPELIVILLILFAMAVQGAIGFGSALIAMPILISVLSLKTASPLFALLGQTAGIIQLLHYRQHFQIRGLWRIFAASLCAIPIGITIAQVVDQHLALAVLGLLIIGYALYGLFGTGVPELHDSRWDYVFGFANGLLHGAYNTGGPPLAIYGNAKRWPPAEFKTNLQTLFFINGLIVIGTHIAKGNYTETVMHYYFVMVIPVFVGLLIGQYTDRWVAPETFRRAVLVLLILLGIKLLF